MNVLNAAPKAIVQGIRDVSGRPLPILPEQIPTHCPYAMILAEEGGEYPQLVDGAKANAYFGANSFNLRSKYANHQTVLVNTVIAQGNSMVIQRLKPEGAATSTIGLKLEVVADTVPQYERRDDGTFRLNASGAKIPTGDTLPGYTLKWHKSAVTGEMGAGAVLTGALTGADDQESDVYPMFEKKVSSFGAHGDNKGFRLWAPTARDAQAGNVTAMEQNGAFIYRLQNVKRSASGKVDVVETNAKSRFVDFTLKTGTFDAATNLDLGYDLVVLDRYRNLEQSVPKLGNFSDFFVYESNLEEVLLKLYDAEKANHPDWPDVPAGREHLINILTGVDQYGVPYKSIRVLGSTDEGLEFTSLTNHFATGGDDGDLSLVKYDEMVRENMESLHTLPWNFLNDAMWPISVIYDSGYTIDTKKELLNIISERKDTICVLSTQDVMLPQNTAEQETSIAIALRERAQSTPESSVFGTHVCRAMIVGQSGYLRNSSYRSLLPLTIEFAQKAARFMGAGDGIWKTDLGYSIYPNNKIEMFRGVNVPYKPQSVYDNDWEVGLIWAADLNRTELYWPQTQTVYNDSTSVLNSSINVFLLAAVQRIVKNVWRTLTGNDKLTKGEFIEESNKRILAELYPSRFDGRPIFEIDTQFTDFDDQLGYSWTTVVRVGLNNMRTVNTITVEADRYEQFA